MNIAILMLAAALGAGNAEFDRAASEGAAKIAMARYSRALAEKGAAQGVLKGAMLADTARFASPEKAREECRRIYAKSVDDDYAKEMCEISRRLSLPDGYEIPFPEVDRKNVEARFAEIFDKERNEAVVEQAKGIVASMRPTESEFEEKPEDVIRKEMTAKIAEGQKSPVFEENLSFISEKMVDPVIASANAERKRQGEYLMRARCEAVSPSALAAEIESRLKSNVADRAKKSSPADAWGVFPSVIAKGIPAAVERRITDRFTSRIDGVGIDVSEEEVARIVAENPEAHARKKDSERRFAVAYSSKVLAEALESAVAEAPEGERDELRAYLSQRLQSDNVAKAVDRTVRRDVMPKWRAARESAAQKLAENVWPGLCDGTWFPSAGLADETAARSDYSAAVKGWRNVKGMEALAGAAGGKPVMEEADARADACVSSAFDIARNAIAAQNGIVDSSHAEVLAEARARKNSFWRRTPDMKAIVDMLTEATEDRWSRSRIRTLWPGGGEPSNASEQHAALFPSVRRKIELMAKLILEEMETPEEKPPEETPDEEPPEEEPAFTILVEKRGGKVEAKLLKGKEPVAGRTVDARMSEFESAMREISGTLGREFLRLEK